MTSPSLEATFLSTLRVNTLDAPITIDDPRPHFSWRVNGGGKRGVVAEGYEIVVSGADGAALWSSGKVTTNRTTYIPCECAAPSTTVPAGLLVPVLVWSAHAWSIADGGEANLTSDRTYHWRVRSYPGPTAWANASFSTALLEQADWAKSRWIQSPGGSNPGQFASQMRKVFTLPEGVVTRGRIFLALPGYGEVSVNGRRVDDPDTGSRMLSQYDVRMLYVRSHTMAFLCSSQIHPHRHSER